MGIFQQYYPNTVGIEYDNSHTKEIRQADISRVTEDGNQEKPFLFKPFEIYFRHGPGIGSKCADNQLNRLHKLSLPPLRPVGRDEIRYAGSPLKYSRSEAGDDKTVTVVELGKKGTVSIKLNRLHKLSLPPLRFPS